MNIFLLGYWKELFLAIGVHSLYSPFLGNSVETCNYTFGYLGRGTAALMKEMSTFLKERSGDELFLWRLGYKI
jgi:phage-related protein